MPKDILEFCDRAAFRAWLDEHGESSEGVWLLFGKKGGPVTLTANEALEEALCFGWIDGQMQSLGDEAYKKYFARRRKNSHWSERNKALVAQLEKQGLMTDHGRSKVEEAKENGRWNAANPALTEEHIASLGKLLEGHEPARTNFDGMSPSVRKTYARAYFDAKTDAGREKRLARIVERLDKNLKPM